MRLIWISLALAVSLAQAQEMPVIVYGEVENAPDRFVVHAINSATHVPGGKAFSDSNGRFQLGPLDPGLYEFQVTTELGDVLASTTANLHQNIGPLVIRLRDRVPAAARPIRGLVSIKDLRPERRAAALLLADGKPEKAVERDPSFALAHNELAIGHMLRNRPWDARNELLKAIELEPGMVVAYTNLAVADLAMGYAAGAERCAMRAMELEPSNVKARQIVEYVRQLRGQR